MKGGSNKIITVYNLSAGQEDIFLITINTSIEKINILIDGGRSGIRCLDRINKYGVEIVDYIVLTHIDTDHIQGLLKLLKKNVKCKNAVIVYNKFVNGLISYNHAEKFEKLIYGHKIIVSYKEYQNNSGNITFLSVNQRMKLQHKDDMVYITFLGPSKDKVEKLYNYYKYCRMHDKKKSDDAKVVNGSSIMFILEYRTLAILMTGDGYVSDIIPSIDKLLNKKTTSCPIQKLDLIKIPHHGSKENNFGLDKLLEKFDCNNFIITNSDTGNVKADEYIATILKDKKVYVSAHCDKYNALNVEATDVIALS